MHAPGPPPPTGHHRRPRWSAALALAVVAASAGCGPAARPAGTAPVPRQLQVVGLGDSVTAGTACGCTNFVRLYADGLADRWHASVTETNLGHGGLTAAGLLDAVDDDTQQRALVAAADVVLVTIGANDLTPALKAWDASPGQDEETCGGTCDTAALGRVGDDIGQILAVVHELRRGKPTLVLVTTYWNVFEDGDVAAGDRGQEYLRWSDGLTRRLNAAITDAAHAQGAEVVDLYAPFKADGRKDPTPLLAGDGDHPDAAGHRLIAETLLQATPASPAAASAS